MIRFPSTDGAYNIDICFFTFNIKKQYFRNMYAIRLLLISFVFCYILFNVALLHFKSKTSLQGVNTYCREGNRDGL